MSETRFKKDEIYLLPVKEIRTENTRSFYIVEADGMEYAIPLFAFQKNDPTPEQLSSLELVHWDTRGSLVSMVVRGEEEAILETLRQWNPLFCESLPLTLEEVFISEMEAAGYDIDNILS